jgi:signal peptidase II
VLVLSALGLLLLDQATKSLIRRQLPEGRTGWRLSCFEIRRVTNIGAMRASRSGRLRLLGLWAAALGAIAVQMQYGRHFQGELAQVALGAACGGATGNLLEHEWRGAVTDFLMIGWWPAFNLADAGITCGALAALWCMW